jgi:ABC-type transport system involved in multi-copper enzyme maturation permease subunit
MLWLTWRQFRVQAAAVAALVAAFGVLLLITGPQLASLYHESSFASCHSNCGQAASDFLVQVDSGHHYHLVWLLGNFLSLLLPAVIGLFWGAPLIARELDSGSFRLAWNQSVTRERWLAVKLGVLGLASLAAAGVLSLILGWWASPIDHAATIGPNGGFTDRFSPAVFGTRGIVPLGYAAFAFALGVLAGLLVRRTIAAMAVTLAALAVVQIAFPLAVRPHLIPPVRNATAVTAAAIDEINGGGPAGNQLTGVGLRTSDVPAGAWLISKQTTTRSGSTALGVMPSACGPSMQDFNSCATAIASRHLTVTVVYDPPNRYWSFQLIETAIYLALAGAAAWACFHLIRRRLS